MFSPPCATYQAWLTHHFAPQACPSDLARHLPSPALHFRALNNALKCARNDIMYVRHALATVEDDQWPLVEDTVAASLSGATLRLGGALDGMVILENMHVDPTLDPKAVSSMSFTRTKFKNVDLQTIQERMKELKSQEGGAKYADFWTLADFWKHYFPYQPRPQESTGHGTRDFHINLGPNNSGPIMHDLIYPVFNGAVDIMHRLGSIIGAPEDIELVSRID